MSRVCPWYLGYFLLNPLRKWRQNPAKILAPHVNAGDIVFEPGPGMGFFTLELARRVGPGGRVYVSDLQPKMLQKLEQRAFKAALDSRIVIRRASDDSFGVNDIAGQVDFVLSFAVVHEMPSFDRFFAETVSLLKEGGRMLLAEPRGHVAIEDFNNELDAAKRQGFVVVASPSIRSCRSALLEKRSLSQPHP